MSSTPLVMCAKGLVKRYGQVVALEPHPPAIRPRADVAGV